MSRTLRSELLHPVVLVGALGYFVDIYDLVLFSVVRTPSLKALGYSGAELVDHGIHLLNLQMIGMLLGGILWGVLGDRRGRLTILFGSILLYSLANLANGTVHTLGAYAFWRVIAGIGLAGELGGSITLVSEVLSKQARGYGTALVATVGVMGGVVGGLVADKVDWRTAYFIGGGMGLLLLLLRFSIAESGMFRHLHGNAAVKRGQFLSLFTHRERFFRYLRCILLGLPTWYVVGVLATFSPEFGQALGITGGPVKAAYAVLFLYLGLTFGDLLSGLLSQWFRTRKKVVLGFVLATVAFITVYFCSAGRSAAFFYGVITLIGVGIGYWALFVTIAAEQFGTNIRATVTTTVSNFARAATIPITLSFQYAKNHIGLLPGAIVVGAVTITLTLLALWGMAETHGKDLDYHEPT